MKNINNTENENTFENLTPQERLRYLIKRYFYTQGEFIEKAEVSRGHINSFVNNITKKVPKQNLIKITKYFLI